MLVVFIGNGVYNRIIRGGEHLTPGIIRRVLRDVNFAESRPLKCRNSNSYNMSTETSEVCRIFVRREVTQDHPSVAASWELCFPFPPPLPELSHSNASILA